MHHLFQHEASNKQVLENNWDLLTNTEDTVVSRFTDLTRQYWQAEKIRVDICYFAKSTRRNMRNRPYTPLNPTHVVMNSSNQSVPKGDWVEMLYHESSHHLIGTASGFIGGTIMDVAEKLGVRAPRQLWHAYLFYFSGRVSQEVFFEQGIKDYELYMYRNKVFTWYSPYLEKYLDVYMNNKLTLKDATEQMITAIRNSQ